MTAAEATQLELQLAGRNALLEFGSGEGTVIAARQVERIVSVDGDLARLGRVAAELAQAPVEFTPYHADIGPVGDGGWPVDEARLRDWPHYHSRIWRHLSGSPDAVLINGRFRVACLLQAIIHCRPDTMLLFHDFRDHPGYQSVLKHTDMLARVDTLAVLRVKPEVDGKVVLHDLFDHFFAPD